MEFGGVARTLDAFAICIVIVVASVGCGAGDPKAAGSAVPVATDDPVVTFAPVVSLHEDEKQFPIVASSFLDHSNLTWGESDGYDVTIAAGRGRLGYDSDKVPFLHPRWLGNHGNRRYRYRASPQKQVYETTQHTRPFDADRPPELKPEDGYYLDLLTDWLDGRHATHREDGQVVVDGAQAYYDTQPERADGRPGLRITYWLLFGRHLSPADDVANPDGHEGDWERVSVLLRRGAKPGRFIPESVRFHKRWRVADVPWTSAELAAGGPGKPRETHPVVYSANGSHTPYPGPIDYSRRVRVTGVSKSTTVTVFEEAKRCSSCPQWRTWRDLRDVRAQDWYGYGGAWGYTFTTDSQSGPIGPSPFTR